MIVTAPAGEPGRELDEGATFGFGFVASNVARFGFVLAGIGGGTPLAGATASFLDADAGAELLVSLLKPQDSAEVRALGARRASALTESDVDSDLWGTTCWVADLVGSGGGGPLAGRGGGCDLITGGSTALDPSVTRLFPTGRGGWMTVCLTGTAGGVVPCCTCATRGVDLVCRNGRGPLYFLSAASLSSAVRFGGRAGRLEGSNSDARILKSSPPADLDVVTELVDSVLPRLF